VSAESLETLRAWFQANKASPEVALAMKHRATMDPDVVEELKARSPGETDEEHELAFVFALSQIAEKLDMVGLLLSGMQVDMLPPVAPPLVPVSHVDVTPLDSSNLDETGEHDATPA
jgi:hypothetical protein